MSDPTDCNGEDVRDLMLESTWKRFGDRLPSAAVQWLSDDGSAFIAEQTRPFGQ
jgi:putative transposase